MDHEELLEKILDGLGSEYQYVIDAVNGCDTPISFDELHKNLINKEITLQQQHSLSFMVPAMTNPTAPHPRSGYHGLHHQRPHFPLGSSIPTQAPTPIFFGSQGGRPPSRPFLCRCQWCRVQEGTQFCKSLSFDSLIQMSNRHQLLRLLHSGNHRLMRQLIP